MSRELLAKAAAGSLKKEIPDFEVGDTVTVSVRIVEGDKERIAPFRGTVIRRQRSGISATFTVRRIVSNEGVERTFPIHSPSLVGVEVVRKGRRRRARLYYLRQRVGKATRLRELEEAVEGDQPAAASRGDRPKGAESAPALDQPKQGKKG